MSAGRFPQRIKRGSCIVTIYNTSPPGALSIAGPDTSPFIGTSFQVSDDFRTVTVRWAISSARRTHQDSLSLSGEEMADETAIALTD